MRNHVLGSWKRHWSNRTPNPTYRRGKRQELGQKGEVDRSVQTEHAGVLWLLAGYRAPGIEDPY